MKRTVAFFLFLFMLCSLSACGGSKIHSIEDLPGKTVGVVKDTVAVVCARRLEKSGSTVILYPDQASLAASVASGGISCGIADSEEADICLHSVRGLKRLDEPVSEDSFSVAVALENQDLRTVINDALALLSEEGMLRSASSAFFHGRHFSYEYTDEGTFEHTLTVGVDTGMKPYAYLDESNELTGLDVAVARAIGCKAGFNVVFAHVPQAEMVDAVRKGNVDFALGALIASEETDGLVLLSEPYAEMEQYLIVSR